MAVSLITLIIVLVIVGVLLYVINTLIPMDARIRMILNIVVALFVLIWLLQALGVLGGLGTDIRVH